MRTFLGVLIGAFVGTLVAGGFSGVLGGAILGGAIGWFSGQSRNLRNGTVEDVAAESVPGEFDRIERLERKAQYLYEQLQRAVKRIEQLEAATGTASSAATASAAGVVSSEPEGFGTPSPDQPNAIAAARPEPASLPAQVATSSSSVEAAEQALLSGPLGGDVERVQPSMASGDQPARASTPARSADEGSAQAAAEPGLADTVLAAIRDWFMGGNTVVRVGIVILFFGLAFLLKYAYEHTHVPPELRILGVALGGVVLLALGWRLRRGRAAYSQALQGGGVGVLYLTIFAAMRLYDLLPASAAFGLMLCVAAFSAVLAVMQNAQALALLGASGGFLAPILASTGEGSHVALFSYYVLLNLGLLAIAWFKAWRVLNWAGFVFTFGIGMLWGARFYRPEFLATTEPFLVAFYAIYLGMSVLFALRQAPRLKHYLDGTLIFGLPVVAFGMQTRLVAEYEYGAALSALALAFVYLGLAKLLYARQRDDLKDLVEVFLALGVVFATLAIPLALDGRWTSAAWALEGAALLWVGLRQERRLARVFGLLLQLGAAVAFLSRTDIAPLATPVANSFFLGALFLSLAGLFSNWAMTRARATLHPYENSAAALPFWWGVLWWGVAGLSEIDRLVPAPVRVHVALLFVAGSCVLFSLLHHRLQWPLARYPLYGLLPAALLVLANDVVEGATHPFRALGWLAWPVVFGSHLYLARTNESGIGRGNTLLHAVGLWLLVTVGAWELAWWIGQWVGGSSVWELIAWMLVPGIAVWLLAAADGESPWPLGPHLRAYLMAGAAPLVGFLALWLLFSNAVHDGNPSPLPYVPVLSPLDLAQLAALLVALRWYRAGVREGFLAEATWSRPFNVALGVAAFICANGMLRRTLHHWAHVPFDLDLMMSSMLAQAAFSIFWAVLALCAMVVASRLGRRALWMAGAGLMAVVVAKLFLVDLSAIGGVERIVSFIGVGVLMLVVGYFSPVPPKQAETRM